MRFSNKVIYKNLVKEFDVLAELYDLSKHFLIIHQIFFN